MWIKTCNDEYSTTYTNMDSGMWAMIRCWPANAIIKLIIGSMKEDEIHQREFIDEFEPKVFPRGELKRLPYSKEWLLWSGETRADGTNIYNDIVDLIDTHLNKGDRFINFPALVSYVVGSEGVTQ
jgi:hypothetical protein